MCCVSAAAVDGEVEQLDVDVLLMDTSDQPDTQVTPDLISPFAPADDNLEDGRKKHWKFWQWLVSVSPCISV